MEVGALIFAHKIQQCSKWVGGLWNFLKVGYKLLKLLTNFLQNTAHLIYLEVIVFWYDNKIFQQHYS